MPVRLAPGSLLAGLTVGLLLSAPALAGQPSTHWAFQPVHRPAVPQPWNRSWVSNPIDAFVLARLEQKGIAPAPRADRRTLLRRVCLDLTGLPPTPDEQRAFLNDPSPDAYEKLVDRLLASPHYGERWARHWLDVARYADTNGYERDGAKPSAWRYRDYVIDAFNQDKPYNRFLTEQLAGDEVDGTDSETQIATTFLRLGTWDDEPAEPTVDRYDQLDDVLGTTAAAFLGVTLRCARCHDHKFEPFTQVDYYRMLAVFEPLRRPQIGRTELDRVVGAAAELAAYRTARARAGAGAAGLLVGGPPALFQVGPQLAAARPPRRQPPAFAYVWYENGPKAPVTHVLRRGDPARPKQAVEPGVPAVLTRRQPDPPRPLAHSTGRRLWLARWLTRPDNPLVARVMVNRIWQHHFGKGIVATANDFGTVGEPPTHPELLDWLAAEFVARGWSVKALDRLIVLSNTYRLSAASSPDAARLDPKATLLGRWRPRRLEAEAVRDGMLAVSGRLNPQMHGPGVCPPLPRAVLEGQSRPGDGWSKSDERQAARRSVYIFVKRSLAVPELEVLDAPDTTSSCEQRIVSTVAPQALTFLNGDFANEQARRLAERLRREVGSDPAAQVRYAFELALCRPPRAEELRAALDFLTAQEREIAAGDTRQRALAAFCLVLLNTNEFVYLD
jgi:hypothetical protein